MSQKRPFKANILIRYFKRDGLPKNWQKILKEVGQLLEIDPKGFFGWEQKVQIATIFIAKLDTTLPSKKNFLKLGRELEDNRWMIGKLNELGPKALDEVRECLNRPQYLKELLSQKVKEGSSKAVKLSPFFKKHGLKSDTASLEIVQAMRSVVAKEDHSYYLRPENWNLLHSVHTLSLPLKHKVSGMKGKVGTITYHVEKSARTLFLDAASDCCQGVGKAGHTCMVSGHVKENQSFIVFSRKGKIFAQAWMIVHSSKMVILDSLETKGSLNESLVEAVKETIKELKKHFKYVVMGRSPNSEGRAIYNQLNRLSITNIPEEVMKEVKNFRSKNMDLYSDLRNGYYLF